MCDFEQICFRSSVDIDMSCRVVYLSWQRQGRAVGATFKRSVDLRDKVRFYEVALMACQVMFSGVATVSLSSAAVDQ
jgi:hypothetical protein